MAPRGPGTFTVILDEADRLTFFETLTRDFGPDREKLAEAIEAWRAQPTDADASDLHFAPNRGGRN